MQKFLGVVGCRCPPVVTGWIGPPEWAKGKSSSLLVQLGGLLGDHRQTAARRGRAVGGSVDEWNTRIVSRRSWRLSTHVVGGGGSRSRLERFRRRPPSAPRAQQHGRRRIRRWQVVSSMSLEEWFVSTSLLPRLTLQSRTLFRSQGGPLASVPFTSFPVPPQPVRFSDIPCASSTPPLAPSPLVPAGVACHSTLVATTAQRALWWGFWDVGGSQWKVRPHLFVARDGPHGFVSRQGPECR